MPGLDGTGPLGQGSMTGGGRGWCAWGYAPWWNWGGWAAAGTPRPAVQYPWLTFVPFTPWAGAYPWIPRGVGRGGLPWGGGRGRCWGGGRGWFVRRWFGTGWGWW